MLWARNDNISQWALENGYGPERPLSSASSDLPVRGLYLLKFANDDVYIGYSSDIESRLRLQGDDVTSVHVRPDTSDILELRASAHAQIRSAVSAGLVVRNGPSAAATGDFESLVSIAEQQAWINDPPAVNRADVTGSVEYDAARIAEHAGSYHRLAAHARHDEMVQALGLYLDLCAPFPTRTESTYWTVNCYPGSSDTRILTLSMALFDMFFLWQNEDTGKIEAHFVVDERELPQLSFRARFKQWTDISDHARRGPIGHISAGTFERTIVVDDIEYLADALQQPGIARAAATHALGVMRRRPSAYAASHSPQLAAAAVASMTVIVADAVVAPDAVGIGVGLDQLPTFTENAVVAANKSATVTFTDRERVEKVKSLDPGGHALAWLAEFVRAALPHHASDLAANWSLSSLPATSGDDGSQRLYTLNVAGVEVAYAVDRGDSALAGFVVVSAADLEDRTGRTIEQLRAAHPSFTLEPSGYSAAYGDDITIGWTFGTDSLAELDQLTWRESGAALVDRIRGHQCPYARYHSHALCEEVLGRTAAVVR